MSRLWLLSCILLDVVGCRAAYRNIMTPISNYVIENQRKEGMKATDTYNNLRQHLHEIVQDAFEDALHLDNDLFSEGVAESDQKILLLGDRIEGEQVSNFCGSLASQQLSHVPVKYRDGIHFKPTKQIPIPVKNLTVLLPFQWFRVPSLLAPTIFVCYEGDSFLKLHSIGTRPNEWVGAGEFRKIFISNPYNERCRIREILVYFDDDWNNRYLLPRNLDGRVLIETRSILPRVTFTGHCDPKLGVDQPCCLWKFHFEIDGKRQEFHRCFGSIPTEALKSTQVPEAWADLLVKGKMTRRFITPPNKTCRETDFEPVMIKRSDGQLITMGRLNATKCAVFY